MNKKTLFTLLAVFILLVLVVFFPMLMPQTAQSPGTSNGTGINLSGWTKETITQITLSSGNTEMKTILLSGSGSTINGYKANESAVQSLVTAISSSQERSVVSKNAENFVRLGVDDTNGSMLTLTGKDGRTESYIVGRMADDNTSYFLRVKDGTDVRQMSGNLPSQVTKTVADFRDKTVVNIPQDSISKIIYGAGKTTWTIEKKEDKWIATQGKSTADVPAETMTKLLTNLAPLAASDFANATMKSEIEGSKEKKVVTVLDAQSNKLLEMTILEKESSLYALVTGRVEIYTFYSSQLEGLLLKSDEIFKK